MEDKIKGYRREEIVNECGTCGSPQGIGNRAQIDRNRDQTHTELDKIKQCPKCGSHNYKEETIIYEKK